MLNESELSRINLRDDIYYQSNPHRAKATTVNAASGVAMFGICASWRLGVIEMFDAIVDNDVVTLMGDCNKGSMAMVWV